MPRWPHKPTIDDVIKKNVSELEKLKSDKRAKRAYLIGLKRARNILILDK